MAARVDGLGSTGSSYCRLVNEVYRISVVHVGVGEGRGVDSSRGQACFESKGRLDSLTERRGRKKKSS